MKGLLSSKTLRMQKRVKNLYLLYVTISQKEASKKQRTFILMVYGHVSYEKPVTVLNFSIGFIHNT